MIGPAKYTWERELQEKQRLNGYVFSEASLVSKLLSAYLKKKLATISKEKEKARAESF